MIEPIDVCRFTGCYLDAKSRVVTVVTAGRRCEHSMLGEYNCDKHAEYEAKFNTMSVFLCRDHMEEFIDTNELYKKVD
jgi:hypothetical protein